MNSNDSPSSSEISGTGSYGEPATACVALVDDDSAPLAPPERAPPVGATLVDVVLLFVRSARGAV